jgi:hypothetical protein
MPLILLLAAADLPLHQPRFEQDLYRCDTAGWAREYLSVNVDSN